MTTVLIALLLLSIFELLIFTSGVARFRKYGVIFDIITLAYTLGALLMINFNGWTVLLVYFGVYRIFNLLRLVEDRMHFLNAIRVTRITSFWLLGYQGVVLGLYWLYEITNTTVSALNHAVAYGLVLAGAVTLSSTIRHLNRTRSRPTDVHYPDNQLPTVTVAIPARNETDNLNDCIASIISSTYPKLEILVLDDCSQDKRTPDIIRNFARSGVRFLAGKIPPDKWLAKNYAYQQLYEESSGDLIVFCGVDTRFEPKSLRTLVESMIQNNKSMISVIPQNIVSTKQKLLSFLIQPSRYAWELSLPRRLFNRPPVLSTCWVVSRKLMSKGGGFESVANSISPESYYARQAIIDSDGYSFIQSSVAGRIFSVKNISDQRTTSIRTRYPQLHRKPEMIAVVSLSEVLVLLCPYVIVAYALLNSDIQLLIAGFVAVLAQSYVYGKIVSLTYRKTLILGYITLPFAAIYDVGILNYSMWRYEFKEVIWKDRNICLPVMSTYK